MPRESTLGGRDTAKVGESKRQSTKIERYPRNAWDIVSVKCGAFRQGAAASIVFAAALSQTFFAHHFCGAPLTTFHFWMRLPS